MQNQIEQIGENIKDEMKYDNGVVYFSISGASRLVGVDKSNISRGVANQNSSMSKFLTQYGIDPLRLDMGQNGIPDYVMAMIVKYYAYYAGRHCTNLAKAADAYFGWKAIRDYGKEHLGIKDEPQNVGDMVIAAANEIIRHREEIKQLESELGNAKQQVKNNLEKFEEYFDESISLEENIDKFGSIIIDYKKEIKTLEQQQKQFKENSKDNVNHFFWENRKICTMSEGERRAFGRLITKICNRYNFTFDEKTNVKNGQDLNVNHYPLSLLNRIFNLVNGGHNYAYIIEQFADLGL